MNADQLRGLDIGYSNDLPVFFDDLLEIPRATKLKTGAVNYPPAQGWHKLPVKVIRGQLTILSFPLIFYYYEFLSIFLSRYLLAPKNGKNLHVFSSNVS